MKSLGSWHLNKLKFKDKLWITPGLQKSVSIKNQFLSKFIKLKDPCEKGRPCKIQDTTSNTEIFYQHY